MFQSSASSRLTGLSGFDSESIITSLMDAEKIPLTQLQQKRQVVEWRQESYRDITTTLRGFKSSYFDVLNKSSYMLSESTIRSVVANSTSSTKVSATPSADADLAAHLVKVNKLATADAANSTVGITKALQGSAITLPADLTGKSFQMTLDGVSKTISLGNYADHAGMQAALQTAINTEFGAGKITVGLDVDKLSFATAGGASKLVMGVSSSSADGLASIGFTAGSSNRINIANSLSSLASQLGTALTFNGGNADFTINGKAFSFSSTTSLSSVMSTINADSTANVRMTYDEATDKITIKAKQLGAGDNIKLTETGGSSFFTSMQIDTSDAQTGWTQGQDANVTIDGATIVRSTNTFALNGITYTLAQEHGVAEAGETITVSQDATAAIEKIKGFVEKFNSLLDTLNVKVTEKYDRDFLPLTDIQREAMSEDDIVAWEKKAKTGLLQNDSIVQNLAMAMRRAMTDVVEGAGLSLRDVGISSSSYQDKGKLTIDEAKLKEALETKPDQVLKLMNGKSTDVSSYSRSLSATEKTIRYNQSGVFQRLSDLVEDNISTIRDANGKKGILLEKAGISGDLSVTNNLLYTELTSYNDRIADMLEKLEDKETAYYKRFSALETALQKMNQQSGWLTSQMGGG